MARGGAGNEGGKNRPLVDLARRKHFRVPLHANDKSMAGAFDAFDDPIARHGVNDQAAAQCLHRLVMCCIDLGMGASDDCLQSRVWLERDAMAALDGFFTLLVLLSIWHLCADILVKAAALHDVDRLGPAANAEDRDVLFQCYGGDLQLESAAFRLDGPESWDRYFAVITWMDIEVAAAQYQAVDTCQ